MDCSIPYGNQGCAGDYTFTSYEYIKQNRISALKDYLYTALERKCKNSTAPRVSLNVTGYTQIEKDEESLRQAVGKHSKETKHMNYFLTEIRSISDTRNQWLWLAAGICEK